MKIDNVALQHAAEKSRVSARITWEDCNRAPLEVFFEVNSEFSSYLAEGPDSFLVAAIMPALWHGEKRIAVDGEVCPELRQGIEMAMSVVYQWYRPSRAALRIEAKPRAQRIAKNEGRAAFYLTGGVDSLACLRANQLEFPRQHPGAFQDGILIYGLEVEEPNAFQHVVDRMADLANICGIRLIPVFTNERQLEPDWNFWIDYFEGAVLSAVAHALGRGLSVATIASSFDIPNLHCVASHPMLDPYFSSYDVRIRHDGAAFSRLEKTRLLAGWDEGLQHLHVCNITDAYKPGCVNCGNCEKCIRTMLTLMVFGVLEKTSAFPRTPLTEKLLREKVRLHRKNFRFWPELIAPLEGIGRHDLAAPIREALARYEGELGWKGALRRFDRTRLNGSLRSLKEAIRGAKIPRHVPYVGAI